MSDWQYNEAEITYDQVDLEYNGGFARMVIDWIRRRRRRRC